MGTDHGPAETVAGAVVAAREGHDVVIIGDEPTVRAELEHHSVDLDVIHASETIEMDEDPARAIRDKADASVNVAARLLRDGGADAVVLPGSTGAALAAAAIVVGRIKGVHRPAIATILPTPGSPTVLLDAGANPECRPEFMAQFGVMGSLVAEIVFGLDRPRVGLVNIGSEESKGRELDRAAFALLQRADINFVGNVEGGDFAHDRADVFVADGFTGNVILKTSEGTAGFALQLALSALATLPPEMQVPVMQAMSSITSRLDPERYGGAYLVGTKGVVIIAHGGSSRVAIANAIGMAAEGAKGGLVAELERRLGER
jgi:glycerol-3-phosphate acyltransferase PlsX